jgi:hypothetical protein
VTAYGVERLVQAGRWRRWADAQSPVTANLDRLVAYVTGGTPELLLCPSWVRDVVPSTTTRLSTSKPRSSSAGPGREVEPPVPGRFLATASAEVQFERSARRCLDALREVAVMACAARVGCVKLGAGSGGGF